MTVKGFLYIFISALICWMSSVRGQQSYLTQRNHARYSVREANPDEGAAPLRRIILAAPKSASANLQQEQPASQSPQDAHQFFAALQQYYAASKLQPQQQPQQQPLQQQLQQPTQADPNSAQNAYLVAQPVNQNFAQYTYPGGASAAVASPASNAPSSTLTHYQQPFLQQTQQPLLQQTQQPFLQQTQQPFLQQTQQPSAAQTSPLGVLYSAASDVSRFQFSGNGVNYSF